MSLETRELSLPIHPSTEREYYVAPRRAKRRRHRRLPLALLGLALFLSGFLLGRAAAAPLPEPPAPTAPEPPAATAIQAPAAWELRLVNADHPLPEDFVVPELTDLENGQSIDSRVYPALQAMLNDCRTAGYQPLVCSSFRTWEKQAELFQRKVQSCLDQGMDQIKAEEEAAVWVARPGTSEHQAGLAVDIVDKDYQLLDEAQEDRPVQQWLMAHCADYGFILRYPTDQHARTGVGYEPWHYRYVGTEAARTITEDGLCLEAYLP